MPLIYEKYGVDSARFSRSNFYYSTTIDDYVNILQAVKVRLDTLKNIHEDLLRANDSILKAIKIKNFKKGGLMLDSIVK
jgi:hypothetical protein